MRDERIFRLKWKILIALSIILSIVNAGLAYLVYVKSTGLFEAEQAGRRLTQMREFEAVMAKAIESMSAFASFIPRLSADRVSENSRRRENIILAVLEEHGPLLDLELGVEAVHYYEQGRLTAPLVSWPSHRLAPETGTLLQSAARDEVPQGGLVCDTRCVQVVILPLLQDGVTHGFLAIERAIGEALKEFQLLSGADIAVLVKTRSGEKIQKGHQLSDWGQTIAAVTHRGEIFPVLAAISNRHSMGEVQRDPQYVSLSTAWYEVLPIAMDAANAEMTTLLVNRITSQVEAVHDAIIESVLLGGGGLILSEIVLLVVLWSPLQRLQDAMRILPLLSHKSYPRLRDELTRLQRDPGLRDEIDLMVSVIGDVSVQIEALDRAQIAAEEALRQREQSLQLAQSMARVVSWTGRPLDGYFEMGPGARDINPLLVYLKNWAEFLALVHPEDRHRLLKIWRGGRAGDIMDIEFRLLLGEKEIDIHAVARFDPVNPGGKLHASGMMQDISEMRAVQRALKGHRDRLEVEVLQRTSELVAARNQAERMAETKGRFLANMSHEIRTPLHAIIGLSQIGRQRSQSERTAATFEQIMEAGEHLLNVVNDVLDISKLEAGKLSIEPRSFDLRKTIRQCTDMLVQRIGAKSLSLSVSVAEDIPERVIGDDFRLQQILINLLSNAVKFTEEGCIFLNVSRDEGDFVFRVRDTGVGIPREQLGLLFARFHQAKDASGNNREGAGLGLSISNTLAIMMGGEISVSSELGNGSEFILRLPMHMDSECETSRNQDVEAVSIGGQRLSGIRVLVVDDGRINRSIVEALLSGEGAQVAMASNGKEALAVVMDQGEKAFDVVLMDVEMPEMDGRQATREIRKGGCEVPIIGLTAHVSADERRASVAAGMQEQLVKPVMKEALVEVVLAYAGSESPGLAAGTVVH